MIRKETEDEVVALYKRGKKTRDIIKITGINSNSSLYRILDKYNVPKRPEKNVKKITIAIDEGVMDIIHREKPENISGWICNTIKKAYE